MKRAGKGRKANLLSSGVSPRCARFLFSRVFINRLEILFWLDFGRKQLFQISTDLFEESDVVNSPETGLFWAMFQEPPLARKLNLSNDRFLLTWEYLASCIPALES